MKSNTRIEVKQDGKWFKVMVNWVQYGPLFGDKTNAEQLKLKLTQKANEGLI